MSTSDIVKKHIPNPTGKGGFGERPEDIRKGGAWNSANTISYQYRRFLNMTTSEFEAFAKTPKNAMTMAEYGAYAQVAQIKKSLPHAKEITDRTEGKAAQSVDITSAGEQIGTKELDDAALEAKLEQIISRRQA